MSVRYSGPVVFFMQVECGAGGHMIMLVVMRIFRIIVLNGNRRNVLM